MKISFIRGAYLNNFEGQNYDLPLTGYSSLFPLEPDVPFPLVKLLSISDFQKISVFNKPIKYIVNRTLGDSQILFGLEKYIHHSDIVHVADPHYYYSYQAARLKAKGIINKLISTWWETIPFNNESTAAKKRIKKFVMNEVDMFVCHVQQAKSCLIMEGVSPQKITVIPLGVDLTLFHPVSNTKPHAFTILFAGRLVEEKGILDLYQAFKQIMSSEKKILLRIVGSGPLEDTLKTFIRKDNLQYSVIMEHKSYKEMPDVFRQANVLCVPSKKTKTWEEQYGMVFIEAMASGVPIISYNTGVIQDIVGAAGLLVKENDIKGIVSSLTQIINDKKLAKKIGTIGRERAEMLFDSRKTAISIEKLYKQIINKYE